MRAAPILLLLLAGAGAAARAGPRDVIAQCAAHVAPTRAPPAHVGGHPLAKPCPGLTDALGALGVGVVAPPATSRIELRRQWLDAVMDLTATARASAVRPPDPAAIPAILRGLSQVPAATPTWWDRFKAWCVKWLLPRTFNAPTGALARWLAKLSPSTAAAKMLLYALLGLTIIGAAAVIGRTIRAAIRSARTGHVGNMSRRDPAWAATTPGPASEPTPTEQPAQLFAQLAETLSAQGRLSRARGLTHRVVAVRAVLANAGLRAALARLAHLAELDLFGGAPLSAEQNAEARASGRLLYASLHTRGRPAPT